MTLFKDPTPRIERASRQTFGVLVSVVNEPGDDRVGYPAVVSFKGKNYSCYAFGDDLTAGDRVHFVEAGGQFWAIQAGSYYTTAYRKALKEWAAKSPATAALARIMKNNRKRYRYQAGTVVSTDGDTANVTLVGETATRTFPVEFARDVRELSAEDIGKRCLVHFENSGDGRGTVLPSAAIYEQSHDGEPDIEHKWPEEDEYETQEIGFGFLCQLSRSGGGALTALMLHFKAGGTITYGYSPSASDYEFINAQWYPLKTGVVTDKTSMAPWLQQRAEIPFCNCGDYVAWLGTTTGTYTDRISMMHRETGAVSHVDSNPVLYLPPQEVFIDLAPYGNSKILVLSFNTLQHPGLGGNVGYRIDLMDIPSGTRTNLFQSTWAQQDLFPHTGLVTDWQTSYVSGPFFAPNKDFFVCNGGNPSAEPSSAAFFTDTSLPSAFAHDHGYYRQLSNRSWFHPTGDGQFVAGAHSETNKTGYDAVVSDTPAAWSNASLRYSGSPSRRNTWHLRAESWKARVMCPRARFKWTYSFGGDSLYEQVGRIMEYDPAESAWVNRTSAYASKCPGYFGGFAGLGSDNCFYVFTREYKYNSDLGLSLDYNYVTRFRRRLP